MVINMSKIVHIMLAGPVTDGWNYQDNLLTKYHRRLGADVTMITSEWIWGEDGKLTKFPKTDYYNESDVKVIRLPMKGKDKWSRKFKTFENVYESICAENPDVLFVHGVSFMDMDAVVKYIKERRAEEKTIRKDVNGEMGGHLVVYVDNHSDFSNSGTNWISKNILHKILWRSKAKKIEPYTKTFFGVMPARVDWITDMYGIPKHKCELLVMGADDDKILEAKEKNAREMIRGKYGIAEDEFLIMTGGKIDQAKKQTLYLMEAVQKLVQENGKATEEKTTDSLSNEIYGEGNSNKDTCDSKQLSKIRLIVFGSVAPELKEEVQKLADGTIVQYIGWIKSEESYDYFSAADLVVFPGRHSVYWEQVVGMGIPMVCKYWKGTTHVDIGGNVKFLEEDSVETIEKCLENLLEADKKEYQKMKEIASSDKAKEFSYFDIAKKCAGK